jgi:hypothetical protein
MQRTSLDPRDSFVPGPRKVTFWDFQSDTFGPQGDAFGQQSDRIDRKATVLAPISAEPCQMCQHPQVAPRWPA